MASVAREAGVGKATGHLRADFASEDLVVLLMANAGVIAATADDAPDTWRRLVGTNAPCLRHPRRSTPAHAGRTSLHRAMARFGKSHTDEP